MKKPNAGLKSSLPPAEETTSRDIVVEYIKRFPDAPAKTLARLIYRQWPNHFTSLDRAYGAVRYHLGLSGDANRKYSAAKELHRQPRPPGYLPKPEREIDWTPVELPSGKTLVLSDIHFPFHDVDVLESAIRHGKKLKIDSILLNGDILDCHQLSRFSKRPDMARYSHEIDVALMFFDRLRGEFPKAHIFWKLGNHEERMEDFLTTKALAFWGLPALDWNNLLKLQDFGITLVKDKRPIKAGKLFIFHGHEFPNGMVDPVNPARGFFLKGIEHILGSHYHRSSQHSERTVGDHVIATWSIGCACDLHPRYSVVNRWNHGFAVVVHDSKEFTVDNRRVINGKVY